jgi:hypothetical protein
MDPAKRSGLAMFGRVSKLSDDSIANILNLK